MFPLVPLDRAHADILLVNVDFARNLLGGETETSNHLGLWRLGSYLEARGIPVAILNTAGSEFGKDGAEQLAAWLRENHTRFRSLGFHLLSWNVSLVTEILRELETELKIKPIFFGGPLATAAPREVLEHFGNLGFTKLGLVAGYGEFVLERALRNLEHFEHAEGLWSRVGKNFWGFTTKSKITVGKIQRLTNTELDALPFLNPELNSFFKLKYEPVLTRGNLGAENQTEIFSAQGLDVNQGCAFACSYCSTPAFGQFVATYSPHRVVDEIQRLAEQTGCFHFTFTNSNVLFYTREWLGEFCKEILRRGMENYLNWNGYHHPNTLDLLSSEDFALMKRAGCEHVVVGVQTIEPKIAELFNRPLDMCTKIESIQRKVKTAGQSLVIDYITGVPGEDWDAIGEFFAWCEREGVECREFALKLYPGTKLMEKFPNPKIVNPKSKIKNSFEFELVPILSNLAPALDSYALIAKNPNPRAGAISARLRESNARILKTRPLRIGAWQIKSPEQTRELIEKEIPNNSKIPERVKCALTILLTDILAGAQKKSHSNFAETALRNLILAPDDGPPIRIKMRERLKTELGAEKFEALRKKYLKGD